MLKPLKIFYSIGSLEIGGAERQLVLLITHLVKKRHRITIFTLEKGGSLRPDLDKLGVRIISAEMQKGDLRRAPWKLLPAQIKLLKAIRLERPEIVHAFLPLVTCMGALAARLAGTDFIVTSRRALGNHQDRMPLLYAFDKMANYLSDRITVNSNGVKADLVRRERVPKSKIVRIYNGIDIDSFYVDSSVRQERRRALGVSNTQKIIIFIANLIPYKGHKDFLHAASMVAGQDPEARFLLVGEDRGLQSELAYLSLKLKISDRVLFLGKRFDIPELLATSDMLVLASHEEGFSNVLLEAMAAGLPVVATRVGGNPEAIVQGKTGWLCPAGNPAHMARKMIDLLQHSDKAIEWGQNGRTRVKAHFTVERMVEEHLKLYRQMTSGPA